MAPLYTPPETVNARAQAFGRKLTLWGAVLTGLGGIGIIVSTLLNAVWLGILGGPISSISWLALIAGVAVFVWGFSKIRDARSSRSY